jgi:hypothetical protein
MKTQHVLAAAVMVFFVAPILLGLGSFFVIPLVLLAVAVLPILLVGGIVMLFVAWHRAASTSHDDFRPHPRRHLPLHA